MNSFNDFFKSQLVRWANRNVRDFPWRAKKTPYTVFIGELLLQRTTSKQVEKMYLIFLEKYPTILDLAISNLEEVSTIVKPLGLNRRAVALIKASKQIKCEHEGIIPDSYKELTNIFGVGRYIANAIMCFSFDKKVPIVDTNVIRIFQRFFNFKSNKKYIESDKKIWDFADNLLPLEDFQLYNYALLDFGSLVCKSKNPLCLNCTLNSRCYFYKIKAP